jgi:alkylated DNA nucleotide flippase Atl1
VAKVLTAVLIASLVVLEPARPAAWGQDGHRTITLRAVEGLPPGVQPWFAPVKAFISEHSVDPDLWRVLDLRSDLGVEGPNHFLNIDALDEPPPYTGVPREHRAFVARYGASRAERVGRLPFRAMELYDALVGELRDAGARRSGSPANAQYLAAVLAHYVEDAFVPFHAVSNSDGQQTRQSGIHARFETELLRRYGSRLALSPARAARIDDVREFLFATLAESARLAPDVLEADRAARAGRTGYNAAYYAAFFTGTRLVLERRVQGSVDAVASVLLTAWEAAGRPALGRALPERGRQP